MDIRAKAILSAMLTFAILTSIFVFMSIQQRNGHLAGAIQTKRENATFLAENMQEQVFSAYNLAPSAAKAEPQTKAADNVAATVTTGRGIQANVTNLFDRQYISTVGTGGLTSRVHGKGGLSTGKPDTS